MVKKLTWIGIALLVGALIAFIASTSITANINSSIRQTLVVNNLTVGSNSFTDMTFDINGSTYIIALVRFSHPLNVYLFNSNAFSVWNASESVTANANGNTMTSGLTEALQLRGSGAFVIYGNTLLSEIPYQTGLANTTPLYYVNETTPYPSGTYYLVFDNTANKNSSAAAAEVVYLPPDLSTPSGNSALSGVDSGYQQGIISGVAFFLLLIAGIAILVFGFVRNRNLFSMKTLMPKQAQGDESAKKKAEQEYVNALYRGIGKKPRRRKAAGKNKTRRTRAKRVKKRRRA